MAKVRKRMSKAAIRKIIWSICVVLLVLLLVFTIVRVNRLEKTATVSGYAFSIGSLDSTGEYQRNTGFIYTDDFISADGLAISVDKDANIQYKVYYYSQADTEESEPAFLSASASWLTADLNVADIPEGADLCRIVIQPIGDAEVSVFEVLGYANQLEVTHNK